MTNDDFVVDHSKLGKMMLKFCETFDLKKHTPISGVWASNCGLSNDMVFVLEK